MSRIAERLLELRGDEAQGAFAARLGLKQAVYCHYEKARREPSLDILINMAFRLGVTTDYLLGITDTQKRRTKNKLSAASDNLRSNTPTIRNSSVGVVVNGANTGTITVAAPKRRKSQPAKRGKSTPPPILDSFADAA